MVNLNTLETLVVASLVLVLGQQILKRSSVLRAYSIPEPAIGGLIVALLVFALRAAAKVEIRFDTAQQTSLMLAFFATIGLNADLASLRAGGRSLAIFLLIVVGGLVMQNVLGIALAKMLGLDPLVGLLGGSITLSGGHGTGAAWSAVFAERHGLASATEIALACATFGLILGGLIGGPVARLLVTRHGLSSARALAQSSGGDIGHGIGHGAAHAGGHGRDHAGGSRQSTPFDFEAPKAVRLINAESFIETLALVAICIVAGSMVGGWLSGTPFELPSFVCVLFIGVVLRNALAYIGWYQVFERAVALIGNVSLALFLAMALMSLRLWDLAALALPVLVILVVQTLAIATYALFVTFGVMGRNYDAAVLAAGHCGFGLGATPTAIANMQAITAQFGPSHLAFLVVPMVGAFFIDIANAIVIKLFLLLPIYG